MSILLLDVNVLIALFNKNYEDHDWIQRWFKKEATSGWATCPITENGFLRLSCNHNFRVFQNPGLAIQALRELKRVYASTHHFWHDDLSLTDESLFRGDAILGHKQLTDIYLLGLCQRNIGTLVTFDRRMNTATIVNPRPNLLLLLSREEGDTTAA